MPFSGPELVVPPPPLKPAPTGLLKAAEVVEVAVADRRLAEVGGRSGSDLDHWLAGTRYPPESAYQPDLSDPCTGAWYQFGQTSVSTTPLPPTVQPGNTRRTVRRHAAFVVSQPDECSDFGFETADYQGRAVRGLLAKEQTAVEAEFEVPTLVPTNPGLSDGSRVVTVGITSGSAVMTSSALFTAADQGRTVIGAGIPAGTTILTFTNTSSVTLSANATVTNAAATVTIAVDPNMNIILAGVAQDSAVAFALLQEAIAQADVGQGMIHCSAFLAERWTEKYALRFDTTGRLTSANGNLVVSGNGYRGVGPDGTGGSVAGGATTQWAYATDLVRVRRAREVTVYPDVDDWRAALDRTNSVITFRATRPYVVEWAGLLHAAVKVNVLQ